MSIENPTNTPEKKELKIDDDRKFTLDALSPQFLSEHGAKSFMLTSSWTDTNEDTETKLALKEHEDGSIERLLITKIKTPEGRKTDNPPIDLEGYKDLLPTATLHVKKRRFEFSYEQNGTVFKMKYDEFADSALRMLEVGPKAVTDTFDETAFPVALFEVSDDPRFTGFHVVEVI